MTGKFYICGLIISILFISAVSPVIAQTGTEQKDQDVQFEKPLFKPFIERYILDELRQLRQDHQILRTEMAEKVAQAKLESSDRALRYTADTTSNIFYIITASASILVLIGWRSFREIRDNIEAVTSEKLSNLISEYEQRLDEVENKITSRSDQILRNQEEISITNHIHSLWMRAALEKNEQEKISIYDQILTLRPDDVEAITYKAGVVLDIGEKKWALSLADQAIGSDPEYSFAYWQRACSKAELGMLDDAVDDIEIALRLSEALREKLTTEKAFANLKGSSRYDALVKTMPETTS